MARREESNGAILTDAERTIETLRLCTEHAQRQNSRVAELLEENRVLSALVEKLEAEVDMRVAALEEHSARESSTHAALRQRIDYLLGANTAEVERRRGAESALKVAAEAIDRMTVAIRAVRMEPNVYGVSKALDELDAIDAMVAAFRKYGEGA